MMTLFTLACKQALYLGLVRDLFWVHVASGHERIGAGLMSGRSPLVPKINLTGDPNRERETQIESLLTGYVHISKLCERKCSVALNL